MEPNQKAFSLLQVTQSIRKTISERYTSSFWVKAEMNKLNHYKHSGHCYPELVEKENGKVVAQINGILWRSDYLVANSKFLATLKEPLRDGIKILFLARISFDPAHGMALQILDVDPSFTLGDLEREKQESIARLKSEAIFDLNKTLKFPVLPQRIAIISVETSKGYADFLNVISANQWGYKFFHFLFPSVLQGEKAVTDIIRQLRQIRKVRSHFDVVAIIRGGGGDVGLSCYNNYNLAKEIAEFPLPVITGIGHATNETVAEVVSHLNAITPTKLADYLLQRFHDFAFPIKKAEDVLATRTKRILSENNGRLAAEVKLFRSVTKSAAARKTSNLAAATLSLKSNIRGKFRHENQRIISARTDVSTKTKIRIRFADNRLSQITSSVKKDIISTIARQKSIIENAGKNVENMSPENVLKRGFSITLVNGRAVTKTDSLTEGQEIQTQLYHGTIESTITKTTKEDAGNNELHGGV